MNKFKLLENDLWITSDTHFYHKNITQFEPKRVKFIEQEGYSMEEHDKWLIEKWNKTIKPEDTVLHLGDFAFKNVAEVRKRLNGNIILIFGNHDDKYSKKKFDDFIKVDGVYLIQNGLSFKLDIEDEEEKLSALIINDIFYCHYPLFSTDEHDRRNEKINKRMKILEEIYIKMGCKLNVHGHTHSRHSTFNDSLNVCFDTDISFYLGEIKHFKLKD